MNKTITICVIILLLGLTESKKSLKDLINKGISEKRNIEKEKEIFKKIFGEKKNDLNNIVELAKKITEAFAKKKTNEKDMEEKVKTWAEEVSKIVVKTAKIISGKAPKDGNLNIVSAIVETYKKIVEDFRSKKEQKEVKDIESIVKAISTAILKSIEGFKNVENIIKSIAAVHKTILNSFDKKKIFDAISKTNKKH